MKKEIRIRSEEKAIRDYNSQMLELKEVGRKEGIKEGRKEGRKEGIAIEQSKVNNEKQQVL